MFLFALLFAGLAVLGALVGLGHVGHSVGSQSIQSYGWALCLDAAAIAAFLAYTRVRNARRPMR